MIAAINIFFVLMIAYSHTKHGQAQRHVVVVRLLIVIGSFGLFGLPHSFQW